MEQSRGHWSLLWNRRYVRHLVLLELPKGCLCPDSILDAGQTSCLVKLRDHFHYLWNGLCDRILPATLLPGRKGPDPIPEWL